MLASATPAAGKTTFGLHIAHRMLAAMREPFLIDGHTIAVGGDRGYIQILRVSAGGISVGGRPFSVFEAFVHALAFTPDGNTLVSAGNPSRVALWDVRDRDRPRQIGGTLRAPANILSLAVSPDGRTLAAGTWKGSVAQWDIRRPATPAARTTRHPATPAT